MKFLVFAALFALACAQVRQYPEFNRPCSVRSALIRPNVRSGFNVAGYSGTWFEIGRYQQQNEDEADCMSSSYSWGFITRQFTIHRAGRHLVTEENFVRSATAPLAFPDASPTMGLLNVTYYADREADGTNYYILGTDHFQYAVGWGCEDLNGGRSREFAWVLSRTPDLPGTYNERASAYIDRWLDRSFIRNTTQSDDECFSTTDIEANKIRKQFYGKN